MDQDQKWQSLERKLAAGMSIEEASRKTDIPIDKIKEYLSLKRELQDFDSDIGHISSSVARQSALAVLYEVCEEATDHDTRVRAASELLKFVFKEKDLLQKKLEKVKKQGDTPQEDMTDWWDFDDPTKK